jgi:hypothetical protein
MVAVACPVPTAVQGQARGELRTLDPEHSTASCWGLGEGLGAVSGLGLGCLVAVGGGLVVCLLALRRLLAGECRLGQAAQRVGVAGRVVRIHGVPPDKHGERLFRASIAVAQPAG